MASVSCDICFETFSELERVPKIIDCGHTFCSVCLDDLSSRICPTCKEALIKTTKEYPTNYKVLYLQKVATEKSYPVSHIADSLKKMKELYVLWSEMMMKNIREKTDLKIVIANDLTKIQQMLEMNPDAQWRNFDFLAPPQNIIRAPTTKENTNFYRFGPPIALGPPALRGPAHCSSATADALNSTNEAILAELEANLAKIDEALFCCEKMDLKPTYPMSKYINQACFLFDLANRLHEKEEIFVYERVDGKPKYGRVSLSKDVINFHVLDLPKVDKLSSVVSLQDVRKCVTKHNLQTFIKIENETLSFSIINSSFLAFLFIKLCTGETGRKIKGVNASFLWKRAESNYNDFCNSRYKTSEGKYMEFQHIRIEKFMLNDVEVESLDDYDAIVASNNETTFSWTDFVVQMFEKGVCNIIKVSHSPDLICKNAVAKMIGSLPEVLINMQTGQITDSGLSLMYSTI